MTVGPMKSGELSFSQDGWVINELSQVVPVLHQYDRIPELNQLLLNHLEPVG